MGETEKILGLMVAAVYGEGISLGVLGETTEGRYGTMGYRFWFQEHIKKRILERFLGFFNRE